MPPKKRSEKVSRNDGDHSGSESDDGAPANKRQRTEGVKKLTAKERKEQEAKDKLAKAARFIKDHDDPMKAKTSEFYVAIPQLFTKCVKTTDYLHEDERRDWDWKEFRSRLEKRSADSADTWFVQSRVDSLMKGKYGNIGINVDNFVVAAVSQPTLAPSHFILKDHRSFADAEDNAPEKVMALESQDVKWVLITKDKGGKESTNAYILLRLSEVRMWAAASAQAGEAAAGGPERTPSAFGFGASPSASSVAPAPTVAPIVSNDDDAKPLAASTSGFGFGASSAPAASAPALSPSPSFGFAAPATTTTTAAPAPLTVAPSMFGFGSPSAVATPAATAPPTAGGGAPANSFGFGQPAPAVAPAAAVQPATPLMVPAANNNGSAVNEMQRAATTFGQGNQEKRLNVADIMWVMWSESKIKGIRAEHKAGTKIMRKGFAVPQVSADCKVKLIMESDTKDKPAKSADKCVESYFIKTDEDLQDMVKWINECPSDLPKTVDLLGSIKAAEIKEAKKDSTQYADLYAKMHPVLEAELERCVAVREKEIAKEAALVDDADNLYKEGKIASRSNVKILKFYPENEIAFRTWGRISGLLEEGEQGECYPEVFKLEISSTFRKA